MTSTRNDSASIKAETVRWEEALSDFSDAFVVIKHRFAESKLELWVSGSIILII